MITPFWNAMIAILRKDLIAELRSRELVSAMALFALLSVLVFSFALELNRTARQETIGGVLWVTVVFAVILGFNRNSAVEREGGSFDAMLLSPIGRGAIYVGKMLGNAIFAGLIGLILLPVMTILYNVPLLHWASITVLLLGTFGLSVTGTLLSTMTVQTRTRETLLPIVMLPVALPLLLSVVTAMTQIIDGSPRSEWIGWVQLVGVLDVIYFAVCFLLFEYVVEE